MVKKIKGPRVKVPLRDMQMLVNRAVEADRRARHWRAVAGANEAADAPRISGRGLVAAAALLVIAVGAIAALILIGGAQR